MIEGKQKAMSCWRRWGAGIGIGLMLSVFGAWSAMDSAQAAQAAPAVPHHKTRASQAQKGPTQKVPAQKAPAQKEHGAPGTALESVDVLGEQVRFRNPAGYCTLSEAQREGQILASLVNALGNDNQFVHAAAPCSELQSFRSGKENMLDHWLLINLVGPRVDMSREKFLAELSKSPPVENAQINEQLNERLHSFGKDVSVSQMNMQPLGRDGDAVYSFIRGNLNQPGEDSAQITRSETALTAITLVNSLPLAIHVYDASGTHQSDQRQIEQLQSNLHQMLGSLLKENGTDPQPSTQ